MGKFFKLLVAGTGLFGAGSIYCMKSGHEGYYKHVLVPASRLFSPEDAHKLALAGFKWKLFGSANKSDPVNLNVKFVGLDLKSPVGLAAGFDKNAEVVEGISEMGFGFIEVGSVTPEPQPGNDKPRVFRLPEDRAIINRYGFNSDGMEMVKRRLMDIRKDGRFKEVVGVNLGKNKKSEKPIEDYIRGIRHLGPHCDYLVINISSPNTPGLRSLQSKKELEELLYASLEERNKLEKRIPLLLKIAPDLNEAEVKDIANVICKKYYRVDGLIISNTTIERSADLKSDQAKEVGGLSGAPLTQVSTEMISKMYKMTKGQVPIVGVGGISSGQEAYDKILAGASVVQIYTAMIYEGPIVVEKIKRELSQLLEKDNYTSVQDAVGKGASTK